MARSCQFCENYGHISDHGRARSTGWCSYWGRVVDARDSCMFYVRRASSTRNRMEDFDPNIAWELLEKQKSGELPTKPSDPRVGPDIVNLDALRDRHKREQGLKR